MNAQHADIRQGSGNTVIQIVGDGNRVEAGHSHLSLTRFAARRQIRQDFDRLSPYTRSVPLIGREAQMDSLCAFLDQPAGVRVRVVTGPGGCGKTRLALELCEQRARRAGTRASQPGAR
jgi:DNA-binding NtrC family response regulator